MKNSSTRPAQRSSPASRTRASASKTRSTASSRKKAPKAQGLAALLEGGQSVAQTVLKKSRLSGLVGFAPSMAAAVGGYARRKPMKTAGMALGLGGLYYLGRALLRSPGIESSSPFSDVMSKVPEAAVPESVPTI